jgi:hypothetical protein
VRKAIDAVIGDTRYAIELTDYSLMANLVRSGFGIAFMPASAAKAGRGLVYRTVNDPRMHWDLFAALSTQRRTTAAAQVLLETLIQSVNDKEPRRSAGRGRPERATRDAFAWPPQGMALGDRARFPSLARDQLD